MDGKTGKIRVCFWITNASKRDWLKSQHMSRLGQSHATPMIHCPIMLCYWFLVSSTFEGGVTQPENGEFLHLGRRSSRWVADECLDERFNVYLIQSVTPCASLYELQRLDVCIGAAPPMIWPRFRSYACCHYSAKVLAIERKLAWFDLAVRRRTTSCLRPCEVILELTRKRNLYLWRRVLFSPQQLAFVITFALLHTPFPSLGWVS